MYFEFFQTTWLFPPRSTTNLSKTTNTLRKPQKKETREPPSLCDNRLS